MIKMEFYNEFDRDGAHDLPPTHVKIHGSVWRLTRPELYTWVEFVDPPCNEPKRMFVETTDEADRVHRAARRRPETDAWKYVNRG